MKFENSWTKDCIYLKTQCYVSFIDRLRLLFKGYFYIHTKIECENPVGKVDSKAKLIFPKMFCRDTIGIEYMNN